MTAAPKQDERAAAIAADDAEVYRLCARPSADAERVIRDPRGFIAEIVDRLAAHAPPAKLKGKMS